MRRDDPGLASTLDPLAPLPSLLDALACATSGLTSDEARRRLETTGANVLKLNDQDGLLQPLVRQLTHPLALLLWVAAVLAFTTQGPTLGIAIVAVIALNAFFALVQERHAQHAVAALSRYLPQHAEVVRDGRVTVIDAADVVPGDVLVVREGDAVCADARLIEGAVEVDLSSINGESVPVGRMPSTLISGERDERVTDAEDVVLSGTTCTGGEARALVVLTGMSTELGRIASLSRRTGQEPSPLERQVRRVAWLIAGVAVLVGVAFLPLGMVAGLSFTEAAVFGIGLLVANVPEGLLPTITLALAVGVGDMARHGGLVKKLSAIETLGSTDVICTDKTGTLTQNRMTVHSVWGPTATAIPFDGEHRSALARALRASATADPESGTGDPTDLALLAAADRLEPGGSAWPRTAVYRFDPRLRLMSATAETPDGGVVVTKGAPEAVLARCSTWFGAAGAEELDLERRSQLTHRLEDLASQGLRLIACAQKTVVAPPAAREDAESRLELLGFVALTDPLRDAVPRAVEQAHRAGITVHVITGDSGPTAAAIARGAGLRAAVSDVVTGTTLDSLSDEQLDSMLGRPERELVFARSSPEDKLRIATRLKAAGHVVAMTGDGVNDAPALKTADIGVAMGRSGTDVAREAATMVLTDDDFATIIRAVENGRRVYDNVRKFILYIFAHAVPEVVPFLLFALSGGRIPLGLTVAQILMIDLGTETLPALALGREASEPGGMDRPPRPRHENIITKGMLLRAWGILGVTSAILVVAGFLVTLHAGGWHPGADVGTGTTLHETYLRASTMVFAGIVVCQVGTALAARTDRVSLLRVGVLGNRLLLGGIAFELVVAALAIYAPPLQHVLGTRALTWHEVAALSTFPVVVWGVDELYRWWRRREDQGPVPSLPKRVPTPARPSQG